MSFANIDLEAQKQPLLKKSSKSNYTSIDTTSNETNNLDNIIDKTSQQLQSFNSLISQFDQQRKQLGSKRDSIQLRTNIDKLVENINELYKAIQHLISNLSNLINKSVDERNRNEDEDKLKVTNRQVVIKERLVGEYNDLDKKFKKLVKIYNEKKKITPITTSPTYKSKEEDESVQKQQQQLQLQQEQEQEQIDPDLIEQTELQYHLQLTEERNREIEQVHESVMEVNTIFKDLNQLVHQQGEQLNTIEDNILQLHGNTQQASHELTKANEYQKKKGKWTCILLVALSILALIIVLIVIS
ncbi:VAM3 [Candida jiufengensis]|uniref:VAM3 n=1 Tax=Candida jiufengensis TaxID=497108 RepID=UPI0022259F39|nr:VAM3 [Candida jiufengensis]KAI5952889.1 VAM3 [Candida jiufengensis]